jgi:DNA-binding NarL/FixJ family response regulator
VLLAARKRIVVVEDHQLLREGLKAMLTSAGYEIAGEAADGVEAIRLIKKLKPDLATLDLSMPRMDGFSVLRDIKAACPEVKILVLTIHETDQYLIEAFQCGADGYCVKDSSRDELCLALRSAIEGKMYISPRVAKTVLHGFLERQEQHKSECAWEVVSPREREILKLLAEGYQNKQIAELLHISAKTVEKHRANMMQKLDLHNSAALTAFAYRIGLVQPKT